MLSVRRHGSQDLREGFMTSFQTSEIVEIAAQATKFAQRLLDADGASVALVEGEEVVYVAGSGAAKGMIGRRNRLDDCFTGAVLKSGEGRIFDPEQVPKSRERAKKDAVSAGLVVPVFVDGAVIVGTEADSDFLLLHDGVC